MSIGEKQPVSDYDRHHAGRQRKIPENFATIPQAPLINMLLLAVRLQLAALLDSFPKLYQEWI